MIRITIDSNLINVKGEIESVNLLELWHSQGIVEIVGSQRLFDEMGDPEKGRQQKAKNYKNIFEPYTVGYSKIGSSFIGSGKPTVKEIAKILFPNINGPLTQNQLNDVMHLTSHAASDSLIFVSNNSKDFLHVNNKEKDFKKQKRLKEEFNILVMHPEDCVQYLQTLLYSKE